MNKILLTFFTLFTIASAQASSFVPDRKEPTSEKLFFLSLFLTHPQLSLINITKDNTSKNQLNSAPPFNPYSLITGSEYYFLPESNSNFNRTIKTLKKHKQTILLPIINTPAQSSSKPHYHLAQTSPQKHINGGGRSIFSWASELCKKIFGTSLSTLGLIITALLISGWALLKTLSYSKY